MKDEYKAISDAGFILQVDCPDVAMTRVSQFSHLSVEEFKRVVELQVEVVNYALQDIDPDRMRLHVCWGTTEGPHNHDVPLREIVGLVLQSRPLGLSIEGANPRHGHEWKVWEDVRLPDYKVLIPAVLDTTTNFIEHPGLIAQRILNYANLVGRETSSQEATAASAPLPGAGRLRRTSLGPSWLQWRKGHSSPPKSYGSLRRLWVTGQWSKRIGSGTFRWEVLV